MGNVTTLERSSLQKQMIKKTKQILSIFIRRRTKCIVQLELHDFFPIVSFQLGLFSLQLVNNILPIVRHRSVACRGFKIFLAFFDVSSDCGIFPTDLLISVHEPSILIIESFFMFFHSFLQLSIFHISPSKLFFPGVFFYPHLGQSVLVFLHSGNVGSLRYHREHGFFISLRHLELLCSFLHTTGTKLLPFLSSTLEDPPLLGKSSIPLRDQWV